MFRGLTKYSDLGIFLLRVSVGVIFILHGVSKFSNITGLATAMGVPSMSWLVYLLAIIEVVGGAFLILGVYVNVVSTFLAIVMLGAIYFKSVVWGISFVGVKGTGWEFDLVLLAANIAIATSKGSKFILAPKEEIIVIVEQE